MVLLSPLYDGDDEGVNEGVDDGDGDGDGDGDCEGVDEIQAWRRSCEVSFETEILKI